MTAADATGASAPGWRRQLLLWRQPLYRTGHLLVVNSVASSLFGVAYWLLVARLNPPDVVGLNSAVVSAMMLLAGAAQLNLMSALLRFVPTAGAAASRMIFLAYLVGSGFSGLAAVGFLFGLPLWAADLESLLWTGPAAAGFVLATMCWSLFVMQDNVLVAVGRPGVVPVENSAFAALKILVIIPFSLAALAGGIWLSWAVGMAITVAGTTAYLFLRAVPAFVRESSVRTSHVPSLRELGRFVGPDYLGSLAWIAGTSLAPLLVLDLTDPGRSAVFALAWSICITLYQVPIAFGQSLVAHGVRNPGRLDAYHRQALRHTMEILAPVVVLVVAFAPFGLRVFGDWYADNGTGTMRLLALSAVPNAVVSLVVSRARVARRMTTVVVVLVTQSVLVLGFTALLVPHMGIVGAGLGWLIAQTAVAAALLSRSGFVTVWRRGRRSIRKTVPRSSVAAALAGGQWQRGRTLPTVSDTAVIMVRKPDGEGGVLKITTSEPGSASLRNERDTLRRLHSDSRLGSWRELLPSVLGAGELDRGGFLLTSRLPGRDGLKQPGGAATGLTAAAMDAIAPLHRLGRTVRTVDAELLGRSVYEPAEHLRRIDGTRCAVDRLAATLREQLEGRRVGVGWTHGDFFPGNVLVGTDGRVTGIVDWGQAREHDLTLLDIASWLLFTRRRALGASVAGRLGKGDCWTPEEMRLLSAGMDSDSLSGRALLLLAWLRHVAVNLAKSDRYASSPLWVGSSVVPVLRQVADD
ncbi:MAG TPA: phosphotransferase [Amycolatopsis sp.]|uniref:phosphotransferase n=1 Tax=Amycolatopsis sp. TaxID=37632 RepID=UPI002B46914E|nr:phosphotransferase [Amycolatopsis sp.]HKS45682.1 phosphotransferase [Amycolatopsis sp.]